MVHTHLTKSVLIFCENLFSEDISLCMLPPMDQFPQGEKWYTLMLQKYEVWINFMLLSNPSGWYLLPQEYPIYPCSYAAKHHVSLQVMWNYQLSWIISFPAGSRWFIFHTIMGQSVTAIKIWWDNHSCHVDNLRSV